MKPILPQFRKSLLNHASGLAIRIYFEATAKLDKWKVEQELRLEHQ